MSGRGRGGRGGRGGISKSFNREQLTAMGVVNNEPLPGPVTQPPPLYPLLDRRPVALTPSMESDYLLILKQDFIDRMQLSPFYLKMPQEKSNQPEQEIDRLVAQLSTVKEKYDWKLFPAELRPKTLARRLTRTKIEKTVNVEQKLNQLEKIEIKKNNDKNEKDEDESELIDEDDIMDEEQDEEMDDGTDYANNYFDNGEAYEDEDDNLDDGPIY